MAVVFYLNTPYLIYYQIIKTYFIKANRNIIIMFVNLNE